MPMYIKRNDDQCTVMNNYFDNYSEYGGSSGKDQIHWCNREASSLVMERPGNE